MTCLLQTLGLEKGIVFVPSHCAAFGHNVVKGFNDGKIPLVQLCLFTDGGARINPAWLAQPY